MSRYSIVVDVIDLSQGAATAPMDLPLPLDEAVWTPECRGADGLPRYDEEALRRAIRSGKLRASKPAAEYLVTRLDLADWIHRPWPAPGKQHASSSTAANGESLTATLASARDAALETARALRKRSPSM